MKNAVSFVLFKGEVGPNFLLNHKKDLKVKTKTKKAINTKSLFVENDTFAMDGKVMKKNKIQICVGTLSIGYLEYN